MSVKSSTLSKIGLFGVDQRELKYRLCEAMNRCGILVGFAHLKCAAKRKKSCGGELLQVGSSGVSPGRSAGAK